MAHSRPDALLYVAQKAFVQLGSTVLILNDPTYGLDFPGGKIQQGELDLIASLRREVFEETGLKIEIGRPCVTWIDPLHPLAVRTGVPVMLVGYQCRHLSGQVRLSDEHDRFVWMAIDEPRGFRSSRTIMRRCDPTVLARKRGDERFGSKIA